ncbi:MAG TPA: glycosyl hydrolase 53 family protein [Verrucomicrobiae bacterium]
MHRSGSPRSGAIYLAAAVWALLAALCHLASAAEISLNSAWNFARIDEPAQAPDFDDSAWSTVDLPHTARIEIPAARQWQGICWYRKKVDLPASASGQEIILRFEGAMNAAEIWVNGAEAGKFMGGYLPYVMDITKLAHAGQQNVIAVRLDNRDNPITGPKPLPDLDFNLYGGLYRGASVVIEDKLHITDPILANSIASGGVFVSYPSVSTSEADVRIETQVANAGDGARSYAVKSTIFDDQGLVAGAAVAEVEDSPGGARRDAVQTIHLTNPKLWSPQSPCLYRLISELDSDGKTLETRVTRIGVRQIQITADGLRINGQKMKLRGCNRHQEYPYIGNAVPDAAQYRDALKIKEAGFDLVRLSHYPQSPAFLDACDELGLVVLDAIFGWQYFNNDPAFTDLKLQECRQMVRRDRNHPCVLCWEVSLNETAMPKSFVERANAAAHEEYPGGQCYTCGWQDGYDVFIQARQHGGCRGITNKPCLISEYGDWEYYAQNAGFEQGRWKGLKPAERSSRQAIGGGETRLLQQAMNFQEAHNDDLATAAIGDCVWVMFDYSRGYADSVETSGVMDLFRLPKFAYWFYRTQRDSGEMIAGQPIGPAIFIANDWTEQSPLDIRVFSNCEEVALFLNGELMARQKPDVSRVTTHLRHAPFTFKAAKFLPGVLRAVGYIGGSAAAQTERQTPGEPASLSLRFDENGRKFGSGGRDTIFCRAEIVDTNGALIPGATNRIYFTVSGQARIVGSNPVAAEAGVATVLLDTDGSGPACAVSAACSIASSNQARILSASASPGGSAPPADPPSGSYEGFACGADLSFLRQAENRGTVFKDHSNAVPCMKIFRDHGYNWIRLRLFVEPVAERLPNDLFYTLASAQAARQLGFKFLLDFHYANSWADPAKQPTPTAWKSLSHEERVRAVFEYTRDAIAAFRDAGVMPDMVQIGNEITHGMLWPDGRLPAHWDNFSDYLRAGVRGVEAGRGARARPKIMLQLAEDGKAASTKYFFDNINSNHVPFDVIGFSYYPRWHGSIADLRSNLDFAATEYGKEVMVVETGYSWRENSEMRGRPHEFPETPEGQRDFLEAVTQAVLDTPRGLGRGVFWWEPAVTGFLGGRGFFDEHGNALPVITVFDKYAKAAK